MSRAQPRCPSRLSDQDPKARSIRPSGVCLFLTALLLVPAACGKGERVTTLTVGEMAPVWSAPLMRGGDLSLASLRGKPVLAYFWADWCPPCVGTPLDALQALPKDLGDRIHVVTVGVNVDQKSMATFLQKGGYTFPVALVGNRVVKSWGLKAIPVLVGLDARGQFMGAYGGFREGITRADLDSVARALSAGRRLPHLEAAEGEQLG
jgi:thiol-disulfide isomerase/thioredoxin